MEHTPVLVKEIIELFAPEGGDHLLDATLGLGGHTKAFIDAASNHAKVTGIEVDAAALAKAQENLTAYGGAVRYLPGNYYEVLKDLSGGEILSSTKQQFSHILFDLGIGSHQLDDASRGFSFQHGQTLDMAFGVSDDLPPSQLESLNHLEHRLRRHPSAQDIVAYLSLKELATLIRTYGEERFTGRAAAALKDSHGQSAAQVSQAIKDRLPPAYEKGRIHPATRTFQALRLAVNRELEVLEAALPYAIELLASGGKLAVISFHSLEDRIVKHTFRAAAKGCICPPEAPLCICGQKPGVTLLTKKPITATPAEIASNPRSRSAKLRAVQKISDSP